MKKSSVGKRAIASACALTLALSMPVLAFAGDPDNAAQGDGIMVAADTPAANLNTTDNTVTSTIEGNNSGVTVQPANNENQALTNAVNTTVDYESDGFADQDALNTAIDENGAVLEEVSTPSAAFTEAANGGTNLAVSGNDVDGATLTVEKAAEIASNPENYISANTFKVNALGLKTGEAVTVVYAPDANAEDVVCYVYYTYTKDGVTTNAVKMLPAEADGSFKLELAADQATANITFMLLNGQQAVQNPTTATDTTHVDKGGNATDGYEFQYTTGEAKAMLGNGQLNWSAQATADVHQADTTVTNANLEITASATPNAAYDAYQGVKDTYFPYAKAFNVVVSSADADNLSNGVIKANVGAANRAVRVFYTDADNYARHIDLVSDADGNVTLTGVDPSVTAGYTFAVAPAGETPDNPDTPIIPDNPDQPVNPDNPTPVVPGDEGNGDGTDNGAAEGNGVTATDKGTASPKTGIF